MYRKCLPLVYEPTLLTVGTIRKASSMSNSIGQNQTLQWPIWQEWLSSKASRSKSTSRGLGSWGLDVRPPWPKRSVLVWLWEVLTSIWGRSLKGKNSPICSTWPLEPLVMSGCWRRLRQRRTSSKGTYYKDPSLEIAVVEYDSTSESEDEEVCVAELVQGKPYECPALTKPKALAWSATEE